MHTKRRLALLLSFIAVSALAASSAAADASPGGTVTITVNSTSHIAHPGEVTGQVMAGGLSIDAPLVQLDYALPGKTGWEPFKLVRVNAKTGKFVIPLKLAKQAEGFTYKFRVTVPRQTGWEHAPLTSTVVKTTVQR